MTSQEAKEPSPKRRGRPPKAKPAEKLVEEAREQMQAQEAPAIHRTEAERKAAFMKEEVMVEFLNLEEPGMMLNFTYGSSKEKKKYSLFHGGKYKLPRNVVQHIESRQVPIWKFRPDGEGSMKKDLVSYKPRFQCRQVFE